jgi:hypothetical protein
LVCGREAARKKLAEQHHHTDEGRGLAKIAAMHLDIKDLMENVLIDLGMERSR